MIKISKQAKVAYNAKQMYDLVNDIESYPDFLPWCIGTEIVEKKGDVLIASVFVSIGKIKQKFTTENEMQENRSISMRLVEGPFTELLGHWRFNDIVNGECIVSLDMQFEFKNNILKHALGATFKRIANTMVDAFVKRAKVVYGTK